MMKIFRQRGKRRLTGKSVLVIFIVVFFVNFFLPSLFPNIAYFLLSPVWWLERTIHPSDRDRGFSLSQQALIDENHTLRLQVDDLSQKIVTFDSLKIENQQLRGITIANKEETHPVLAAVLSKPNVSPYDTLLIDAGTNKGISVGDFVIAEGSIVLGKVSEAHTFFSKVVLLSTPGTETEVSVGSERVQTTAYGEGGGNLFIRLPREFEVHEDDPIVVPSLGNRAIGSAHLISPDQGNSFTRILFTLPVNLYTVRWVTVEKTLTAL